MECGCRIVVIGFVGKGSNLRELAVLGHRNDDAAVLGCRTNVLPGGVDANIHNARTHIDGASLGIAIAQRI